MIKTFMKQVLSGVLSILLVFTVGPLEASGQQPAQQPPPTGSTEQPAPLSADQLQQLVAPIALYPDALVAQVLGASTFPDQVADANGWLQQNKSLTGTPLMQAVDKQQWDPSVKALTQFPSVLDNMAKNLSWTSSLGEAYHMQAADVMTAVQALRAKAQAAGNLKSGSQITVVQQAPQTIVIQPTNPQVVYVPTYNPTVVYGAPVATPGYSSADVAATAILAFGIGIAVGAAINNSCCGWGYSYWNCNWHSSTVIYHSNSYYGNAAWHGGYYGSSVSHYGPYGSAHASSGYNPSTGTYARGASASNAYGSQAVGQAYNPNTGAYAATHQASNAYGSYGSSVVSKNGNTAYTQHQTTANGTVASAQTSAGGSAVAASGKYGNSGAVGQTANGNKYATANGNVYKNTGSGWNQTQGTPKSTSSYSGSSTYNKSASSYSGANSAASRGYGGQEKSSGTSAFGGGGGSGGGWQSRQESARGSASRSGGRGR
ncbi:MAG TPA: DUF3300 domain-containing protein [Edaphobacter sp.]|jgi:hypothetical protein|nr:DUF3300 domain-containing protein [Edaphobacter sp.]